MAGPHFRAGVVAVVRRDDGQVMAFERADLPGQWQLPQGGIEVGRVTGRGGVARARRRRPGSVRDDVVSESTSCPDVDRLRVARRHALDSKRLGQAHRWFFFDVVDDAIEPSPDGTEFSAWRWVEPEWLIDHVVAFRRRAIAEPWSRARRARSPGAGRDA